MHTIKERYVSFEIAKLLQEKGFVGETHKVFNEDGELHDSSTLNSIPAPTQQTVCYWLLEEYGICVVISPISRKGYSAKLCDVEDFDDFNYIGSADYSINLEESINNAIKYALEKFI